MTSIARVHLTRTKNIEPVRSNHLGVFVVMLLNLYSEGYSSLVEHSAAVRKVPGSNPGDPLCNSEHIDKNYKQSRKNHLTP